MITKMFTVGMLHTNCYVVGCTETREGLIIDPGFETDLEAKRVMKEIDQLKLRVRYIVNTHGHFDHTTGNGIMKKLTGVPILIHEYDAPMLADSTKNLPMLSGLRTASLSPADQMLYDGDVVQIGSVTLKIIHTPGHSRGSISLLGTDTVFTGDTLFAGSIGRTDLPNSSYEEIMLSLKKLVTLPDYMKVYPGHGPTSTIGEEKRHNPFLQNLSTSPDTF
ncbi:MAG: MBL fold metallo-hydrolase [Candidatus Bathyarchaeota archaeon]|nr:MAG: MBL fold metallo-hydrolase [Candidatus Bathyarchaeota archaeon]